MECQDLSLTQLKLSGKQCKERVVVLQPGECHYMGENKF